MRPMGMKAKMNWQLAPRDTKWSAADAHQRILDWCTDSEGNVDWKKYASVHFWFDASAPDPDDDGLPDRQGDYKLPFCDVIDGEVKAVPKGIFGDAAAIQGSRGGVDIPKDDEAEVKKTIEHYYERMAKEFDDDSMVAPWNQKRSSIRRVVVISDLRAADPTVTDEGSTGKITGHAAVYGQTANIGGWFTETIRAGAFDGADLTDVPFFVNHDMMGIPLARSRRNNGNSTMTLTVDEVGLAFEATLDIENNDKSKSLYSAIRREDIDKMSYAFSVSEDEWTGLDTDLPARTIVKIAKVWEISAVTFPAYEGTDIQAASASRDKQALESAKALLESRKTSTLESDKSEMELLKLQCQILAGV